MQECGQLVDGWVVEQIHGRHRPAHERFDAPVELDDQQRVPAQVEEIVVNVDPLHAQDFLPYRDELPLQSVE